MARGEMRGVLHAMISWLLFGLCGRFALSHCPVTSFFKLSYHLIPTGTPELRCVPESQILCRALIQCLCVRETEYATDSLACLKWLCALKSSWRGYKPQAEPDQSGLSWTKTWSSPGNEFWVGIPLESGTLWASAAASGINRLWKYIANETPVAFVSVISGIFFPEAKSQTSSTSCE